MRKNYLIKQILAGLCLLLTISLLISLTLSIGYQKFEIPKYRIINT